MERPKKKLTNRQGMVLSFIAQHIQDTGFPPTIREIGDHLDISSTNGVNDHLKALERKGYLVREDAKSRAIRPLFTADGQDFEPYMANGGANGATAASGAANDDKIIEDVHQIPVLGRIAAGQPITAVENVEDHVSLGQGLIGNPSDVFGLRVKGDSMIDDGIFDGDYLFVKRQNDVPAGQIAAVMVDGDATVKRFYREKDGSLRLQPANSSMAPIMVRPEDARHTEILGKVVAVFRKI